LAPKAQNTKSFNTAKAGAAICVQLQHSNDKFCPAKDIDGVLHLAGSPDEMIWL